MFDSVTKTPETTVMSVQQALAMVSTWTDLSDTRRRDLKSALTSAARLIDLPPSAVLLTPEKLRTTILNQPPAAFGLTVGRMRNIRSGLKTVLLRLGVIDGGDSPLTVDWAARINRMPELKRAGLVAFARYCSATGVAPVAVNDGVLEAFVSWLNTRSLAVRPKKTAGEVRSAWNRAACGLPGWPQVKLNGIRQVGQYILPLTEFPTSFRDDLNAFGERLGGSGLDRAFDDQEPCSERDQQSAQKKPCRPSTVRTRKDHCRWAASALVATGTSIEEITSLACLVTPVDRAKKILRFLYDRAGKRPSAGGGHVADVLRIIAKYYARLNDDQVKQIKGWATPVTLAYLGMTEKNAVHIRRMLDPKAEAEFLAL